MGILHNNVSVEHTNRKPKKLNNYLVHFGSHTEKVQAINTLAAVQGYTLEHELYFKNISRTRNTKQADIVVTNVSTARKSYFRIER